MNILIKNADVLLFTDNDSIIKKKDIAIEGNIIKYIGDVPEDLKFDKIIDAKDKIAMPGLINTHTHIAMSLFRNYADDLLFWEWLHDKVLPIEKKMVAEDVYWGSMLTIAELIKSGVTCFNDMYFFMDEVAKAVSKSKIRASLSISTTGFSDDTEKDLEAIRKFYNDYHGTDNNRITTMIAPHAPYTCSPEYLKKLKDLSSELDVRLHIHVSESKTEIEESFEKYGKSPVKHLYDLGIFERPTLAAHCVHVSDDDIEILYNNNVNVLNNPGSNLKLANGFAPVDKMIKRGINVALATDGSCSNNNVNMFEEINLAAIINKGINEDSLSISASTALKMGTINGAKALGMQNEIGSLEIGKKADLILIDTKKPHFYPKHNLLSSLVYSAQASDVDTVIVDGNILMENCELKTIDIEEVMFNIEKCATNLIKEN